MPQPSPQPLKVYWQPGCSSCLKTKEFLTKSGIAFDSIDVLADAKGFADLEALGIRQVPVVVRGTEWVSGQVLREVARFAGVRWGHTMLPPETLVQRIDTIVAAAIRYSGQLPDDVLDTSLPNRPRTYAGLACHIFQIIDAFVDEGEGIALTHGAYLAPPPDWVRSAADIVTFGTRARDRFDRWWRSGKEAGRFERRADVYYGDVTLHEYLERAAWHSGQHTRQLMLVLTKLAIAPDRPLGDDDFAGLPMPDNVWDDEKRWD